MTGDTRRWDLLLVALAATVMMAGCLQGQASPEERLEQAKQAFQEDIEEEGDISRMEGTFSADGVDGDFEMTIGSNGVYKLSLTVAEFITITAYCGDNANLIDMGEETLEQRAQDEMCEEIPIHEDDPRETEIVEIEEHDDGTLSATVRETDENGTETLRTVTIDEDNKVQEMTVEDDEGRVEMTLYYETRRKITTPEADGRAPHDVDHETTFEDGTLTWEATGHNGEASLDEFTVKVVDQDPSEGDETIATFDPSNPDTQRQAEFTFRFHDDGDGLLSEGDTFTLEKDDWDYEWEYDVEVWDEWAEKSIDDAAAMPAPGALLLLASVGMAAAARTFE